MFYVYKITNKVNGKIYIGKSKNIQKRFYKHVYNAKNPITYLENAIYKHGKDNFYIEELERFESEIDAYKAEVEWIKKLNSQNRDVGYNIANGGIGGTAGMLISKEARIKLSNSKTKNITSDNNAKSIKYVIKDTDFKNKILLEYKKFKYTTQEIADMFNVTNSYINNVISGCLYVNEIQQYKMTDELKAKLSNRIITDEIKEKYIQVLKTKGEISDEIKINIIKDYSTNQYTKKQLSEKYNLKQSQIHYIVGSCAKTGFIFLNAEEKSKRLSETHPGKKHTKEEIEKIRIANTDRPVSEEQKTKQREKVIGNKNALYGKKISDEARQKRIENMKLRDKSTLFKKILISEETRCLIINEFDLGVYTKKQLAEKYKITLSNVKTIISTRNNKRNKENKTI